MEWVNGVDFPINQASLDVELEQVHSYFENMQKPTEIHLMVATVVVQMEALFEVLFEVS